METIYKIGLSIFIVLVLAVSVCSTNRMVQNLYVTGNITASGRLFQTENYPNMYGVVTESRTMPAGEWINLTFDTESSYIKGDLDFVNNQTLIIKEAGYYDIHLGVNFIDTAASPSSIVATRILLNGVEMNLS
jgi:hypothetical protein